MNELTHLIQGARDKFDLTDPEYQQSLYRLTNKLLELADLPKERSLTLAGDPTVPLEFRIALHLMLSKRYLQKSHHTRKVAVVFAMWGEHHRLHPKSIQNPHGEDTIRTKIDQLNWITKGSAIDWHLYAVDDGCPYGSGQIAQEILSNHIQREKVSVLHLNEAIPTAQGPLSNLKTVDDSKKGGAIILGCHQALQESMDLIIYTDADNSVHLGQIGLLLEPCLEQNYQVVLGNRKDPSSVLVKQENRWGIGIKLLRHMQRMVGAAIFSRGILDSQAAFKLYASQVLEKIIKSPSVYDFSFDSDWIAAVIQQKEPFAKVPFAFVDSFEQSASIVQGPMSTWEALLLGLVKSVRHRNLPHNQLMAQVLEEEIKSSKDLDLLIHHLPPELEPIKDSELGNPDIMSPSAVREWIQLRKKAELNT